jgi:hypothetical protein
MLSVQGFSHVHRQDEDRNAGIEQIHAALRESIAAIKLLADDADGMLGRRCKTPPAEPNLGMKGRA